MEPNCPTLDPAPEAASGGPLDGTAYRSVRRMGVGATSEVYEAVHVGLDKPVVVKLLRAEHASDARALERMRFEAQTLARLSHPNITAVSDCGTTRDGRPFFVMEKLDGCTLLVELRRRRCVPVAEAVGWVRQLCTGLTAAHALGIIHRDIKLENLFLAHADGGDTLKILDFGIAKLLPDADPSRAPAPPAIRSQEGVPLGTPQFLAPEQVLCHPVDARTDVYGAASVLYELVTGRAPFWHRTDLLALMHAHVSEAPRPPSALAPQPIEPAIDDVILRALSKRPEDRYGSAAEFSAALEHAVGMLPSSTPARPDGPRDDAAAVGTARPELSPRSPLLWLVPLVVIGAALVSVIVTSLLDGLR